MNEQKYSKRKTNTLIVVGCQWGDEGKGKIVDYLARDYDIVMRCNGGNNAGHTVVIGTETYKFHLVPSGSLQGKDLIMGNGMVIDPKILIDEISVLKEKGFTPKLSISKRAHVIMPYHRKLDFSKEHSEKNIKIGTTGRGIGPTYEDKVKRTEAVRIGDLVYDENGERIKKIVELKRSQLIENKIIDNESYAEKYSQEIIDEYMEYARVLKPYVTNTTTQINSAIESGKRVLFEGAQGTMLDVDHGSYPFVTSSNSTAGGICTGSGVSPNRILKIVGVCKAYTTRVGEGHFPTELSGETADKVRENGGEYGTTTGRPRRCGWLDLVILKHACMINGLDEIMLTKLDVLSGFDRIRVCTSYNINGNKTTAFPSVLKEMDNIKPVYHELDGWEMFTVEKKQEMIENGGSSLPLNAKKYIEFIEKYTGVSIPIVSVGPGRKETIVIKK